MHNFVCALRDWSLFLLVLWKVYNKILLALKARFPGDSQSLCWIPRLASRMWGWERIWYGYCSPVCSLPIRRVWDLILLWLCPPYHLAAAASFSLDVWCPFFSFFGGFQRPPADGCSTTSCNFCALAVGDKRTYLFSVILNQKPLSCSFFINAVFLCLFKLFFSLLHFSWFFQILLCFIWFLPFTSDDFLEHQVILY